MTDPSGTKLNSKVGAIMPPLALDGPSQALGGLSQALDGVQSRPWETQARPWDAQAILEGPSLAWEAQAQASQEGRRDRCMDGQKFYPCSTGLFPLWGHCPASIQLNLQTTEAGHGYC